METAASQPELSLAVIRLVNTGARSMNMITYSCVESLSLAIEDDTKE
jgi:hypothetical protein